MPTDIPMNTLEHVVYDGTELNAFDVGDCNWRKPYSITIPAKPTGVAGIVVTRTASESNCDQLDTTSITTNGTVLYGDTLISGGAATEGYNDPIVSFTSGVTAGSGIKTGDIINALYFNTASAPIIWSSYKSVFENNTLIKTGEATVTFIANSEEQSSTATKGLLVQNGSDPAEPELVWQDYSWNSLVYNMDTGICTIDGVDYSLEEANTLFEGSSTVVYRQYTDFWAGNGKPTGWLVDKLVFDPPVTAVEVNEREQDIWGSYIASDASGSKVIGDVAVSVTAGTGKTYYVYYTWDNSLSGTLPSYQSRIYPNGVTLGTNNMTKPSATTDSYMVSYANGTATGGTLPAAQTSVDTTTYTANGWTTNRWGENDCDYANGASYGKNEVGDLTLYANFTTSTTNGGVTLATNNMTKSNTTADSYTVTYAQGNASNATNLPSKQTSTNTTTYTANGWTTTSGSTTQSYANGAKTGALTANKTLYPCFSQSTTNGGVTLSSNTMSRSATTEDGYTVTYAQGNATDTTNLPSAQTATDTRSYTHNGWATSASGSKAYNKGASTGALSSSITLYPYFDSSVTRGSVTLATNNMTKSSTTESGYTLTYAQGTATSTTVPAAQTAMNTRNYMHSGWATSQNGVKAYSLGASTGALNSNLLLYPYFDSVVTRLGSVTLATNSMTKDSVTEATYTVTFNYNGNGAANTTATTTKVRTYTADGWTTTSGSTTRTYTNGQSVKLTGETVVYPCFTQSVSTASIALPTPTRTGYAFRGWATSDTATSGSTGNYTPTKDVTLYAIWKANTYTVKFNGTGADGGSMSNQTFTYDVAQNLTANAFYRQHTVTFEPNAADAVCAVDSITKDAIFAGWATYTIDGIPADVRYTDKQSVSNLATSGTVNLYAKWSGPTITLPTPTRSGYTFKGWSSLATATSGTTGDYQIRQKDITLCATWEANTYTVTYDMGTATKGTLPAARSATYPNVITIATNNLTKDSVDEATYTVTYNYNGSGQTNTTATAKKTRTYTANGWTKTSGSTTITHANGAAFLPTDPVDLVLYPCFKQSVSTESVTLPTPTRTGHTFKGWATSSTATTGSTGSYTPTENVTLYAIWEINSYAITINNSSFGTVKNGSTIITSGTKVNYDTELTITPKVATGYTTTASSSTGTISSNKLKVDGNETITFSRTGNTYTVTYAQGTATGGTLPAAQSRTYPYAILLAYNSMTKSATTDATYTVTFNYNGSGQANTTATAKKTRTYTANGWTTTSGSTTQNYANGASFGANSTTNLTLYPCFSQSVSTASVTLPTPTRTGYTFKGWNTSSTATSGSTGSYTPTGNVTLYAIWAAGSTASASITFPAVPRQTVRAYTQTTGSNRIFQTSQETQYSGYSAYTNCTVDGVVDGVDVTGPYFVTVKEEGAVVNNTIYKAKFTDGVLYVNTTVQGVGTPSTTSMILSANAYNTTATFIGKPQLDVDQNIFSYGPSYNGSTSYIEFVLENWNPVAVTAYIEATFGDGSTANATSYTIPANSTKEIALGVSSSYGQDLGDVTVYYTDPTGTYLDSKTVTTYVS